jgi:hypothetical protein
MVGKQFFNFLIIAGYTTQQWRAKWDTSCVANAGPGACLKDIDTSEYVEKGGCIYQMMPIGNSGETPADLVKILNPTNNPNIWIDNTKAWDNLIIK